MRIFMLAWPPRTGPIGGRITGDTEDGASGRTPLADDGNVALPAARLRLLSSISLSSLSILVPLFALSLAISLIAVSVAFPLARIPDLSLFQHEWQRLAGA